MDSSLASGVRGLGAIHVRVDPSVARGLCAGTEDLRTACVQAKAGSLEQAMRGYGIRPDDKAPRMDQSPYGRAEGRREGPAAVLALAMTCPA
jgi:hypothetical protein